MPLQAQLLRCVKKKVVERELTEYDRFFSPRGFPLEVEELPVVPTRGEKLSECACRPPHIATCWSWDCDARLLLGPHSIRDDRSCGTPATAQGIH